MNADGVPDIVTATLELVQSGTQTVVVYRMRVLLGRGDGTFSVLKGFGLTAEVDHLVLADLTGDGTTDLTYATPAPEGDTVWTAVGRGDGTFAAPVAITPTEQIGVSTLDVADLDSDGDPDLVYGQGCVVARLNLGGGEFGQPICNPLRNYPQAIAIADYDGDGVPDVALGDASGGHVRIALGDGTCRLASRWVSGGAHVSAGDFTEDGLPDLVAEDNGLHRPAILTLKAGGGTFVRWSSPLISFSSGQILSAALGDLNGDGDADLALGGFSPDNVTVLLSTGNGTFAKPVTYNNGSGAAALSIAIGDVTGDGRPDVVTNTFTSLSVLPGKADGTFAAPVLTGSARPNQGFLHLGDLDGDGDLDAVGAAKTGNPDNASTQVITEVNNGTGIFGGVRTTTLPTNLTDGTVAQLTGDGRADLAISGARGTHSGVSGIFVLPGTATGLGEPVVDATTSIPGSLTAADFDSNGTTDLAATTSVDTLVFSIPGDGRFAADASETILTPADSAAVTSARFTDDTRPDIVTFIGSNPPEFALEVNSSPR